MTWLVITRDVNGKDIDTKAFLFRWTARRYHKRLDQPLEPIPGKPMWNHVVLKKAKPTRGAR